MMANAMGLVQFPCPPGELSNTYHLMRAGESILESDGILSTNPLFLTNREDSLSELGIVQVEEACRGMSSRGINPSVVKYSLASKCIESANIVATTLLVGR
jgi:broad specificity phosphatase PhoE